MRWCAQWPETNSDLASPKLAGLSDGDGRTGVPNVVDDVGISLLAFLDSSNGLNATIREGGDIIACARGPHGGLGYTTTMFVYLVYIDRCLQFMTTTLSLTGRGTRRRGLDL